MPMNKLKKLLLFFATLSYPAGMLLTMLYYHWGYEGSLVVDICCWILTAISVLWTWMYGIVGNYQHFKELKLRLRRKIGNYNAATWTAWALVSLLQPVLTLSYIIWHFNRLF